MTGEQIKGIAEIIQSIVWPAIVILVLIRFGSSVTKFLDNMTELSGKGAGIEFSAKRQTLKEALTTAENKPPADPTTPEVPKATPEEIDQTVSAITPKTVQNLAGSSVLWVDDKPSNNIGERRALEALGIKITTSTSTDDALSSIRLEKFNAIVSDMGRGSERQAGIDLLSKLTQAGVRVPFIVYSANGASTVKQLADQQNLAFWGATNRPTELVQLVTAAIQNTNP